MAPIIKSTQTVGLENGVKILVYGRAGTGKTTLCATAPTPIVISTEGGLLALHHWSLPYIEVATLDKLYDVYRWLTDTPEARQYQTICLDSISEIAEVVLANAKAGTKDPRQAYGEMLDRTLALVKAFRDLAGYHVYVSAKQEQTKGDIGIVMNGPMMPGQKLGPALPYLFDEVFQIYVETAPPAQPGQPPGQRQFLLRTQADLFNDAKDRSGRLDPVEPAHLGSIIKKILGQPVA